MDMLKRVITTGIGLALVVGGIAAIYFSMVGFIPAEPAAPTPNATPSPQADAKTPLAHAVEGAVQIAKTSMPVLRDTGTAIDFTQYSEDQKSALVYLALVDPDSGEFMGSEPVLAVANSSPDMESGWNIIIQGDPGFEDALAALPPDLLTDDLRQRFLPSDQPEPKAVQATYGGYLLPWAAGLEKRLSMGANHVSCPSTCTYAFDFADGTMFPLLAAKGGSVYHAKDTCANFDSNCTNSITLEDRSTTPYTYQIYLHLAQNSIPTALKQPGAPVVQGQYIGNVDDTGYSSGHHVHFMVVTEPKLGSSGYYWGTSVDITFKDVSINWDPATNGGRPCRGSDIGYGKCVQSQTTYVSGNVGSNPPSGGLSTPVWGTQVNTQSVSVSGWGVDDLAVTKLQMLANYDGTWREIGPGQPASPFAFNLDLCENAIPNGPVTLALRVYDMEGNFTLAPLDPRPILKNYACGTPPPQSTCNPGNDQVAIFSDLDFAGACQILGVGSYASGSQLGAVGGDNTSSIKVGQNVSASLFWSDNFGRRSETFTASYPNGTLLDRNLADNLTSTNTLSSLKVQLRNVTPAAPVLNTDSSSKQLGTNPTSTDSIVLSWTGGGGANKFLAELYFGAIDGTPDRSTNILADQSWSIGSLPAGVYNWRVRGRVADYSYTPTSYFGPWSSSSFTVEPASLPQQNPLAVPYLDSMDNGTNGWTATGLWRQAALPVSGGTTNAWVFNNGSNYGDPSIRAGDLTSPPISLPGSPAVRYLRFTYRTQSESSQVYYDQRRVQISVNAGNFQDLLPLPQNDDSMNAWLQSGPISLAAYAGQTVRLRFHFDIVDSNWNDYAGWVIDNVSVDETPGSPSENPANNAPASAPALTYDVPVNSTITPEGDVDYYRLDARAGEVIGVDVIAGGLSPASPLDPILTLLDADGKSVLTENDDVAPGTNSDSRISYLIRSSGTYYLKVKAWNHPGVGGSAYAYQILAHQQADTTPPAFSLNFPANGGHIPPTAFSLGASAVDDPGGSGMKQVQFYWHSPNWIDTSWQLIGTDTNASDGWSILFDPSGFVPGEYYAFFTIAEDWSGNTIASAAWDVMVDPNFYQNQKPNYFPIINR